ncbi:MAG: hypothetical protein GY737_03265 [Desulfobacteraceae bacterium]|nr:hypothetical protein [Desulfobacteraceae bacterium]
MTTTPVVLTAFGTTAKAFETYNRMDRIFKELLPDTPLFWAYSSRMVKRSLKKNKNIEIKDPAQVLAELKEQGHDWAVVQSLHLICGHEFDRLKEIAATAQIRTSMGLPLLTSFDDYNAVADAIAPLISDSEDEATIIVGHGTDHPAWACYPALEAVLRHIHGDRVFAGVVEGMPEMEETIAKIKKFGFTRVRLIPFMLVAGVHFKEDLTREEDSWEKSLQREGIEVSVVDHGVGEIAAVTALFANHAKDALDIIPR